MSFMIGDAVRLHTREHLIDECGASPDDAILSIAGQRATVLQVNDDDEYLIDLFGSPVHRTEICELLAHSSLLNVGDKVHWRDPEGVTSGQYTVAIPQCWDSNEELLELLDDSDLMYCLVNQAGGELQAPRHELTKL